MRGGRFFFALAVTMACWATAGCRTSPPAPPPVDTQETMPALDPAEVARASALARYSQGLIDEYNDDLPGALSNFQQAVALDPDNEELNLRVAIGLLQQKRQDDALAVVESFAKNHSNAQKAQLFLALVYRASEQYDKVEEIYRRMIKQAPSKPDVYLELAALYIKQGNDEAAAKLLEQAANKVDNPLDMLRVLGGLYMKQSADSTQGKDPRKSRDAAIHTFEQVLASQTNDISVLFQLGILYIQDQHFGKALDCYARIEQMNPDNLQIRQRLAMSFADAEGKDEAIASLRAMATNEPDNAHIYYYLGELYGEKGDTTNALLNYSLAATNAPTDPAPFIKKAILQVEYDPEAAKESLAEGLRRLPGDPRLTEMIGYVFFSEKKYDKAIEYFEQALDSVEKANPGTANPTLYYNYAIARQMAGQIPETAALLGKAMDKNPAYLDAYLQFAFRQQNDAGIQQSIEVLEALGHTRQDEPGVYVYLGILNSYLKTFKASIAAFEKAEALVEDSPQKDEVLDASFYFWYAAACEREGQFEKAEKLFGKCLELDPKHAEAYNYLAYMWAEKGIKLNEAFKYVGKALKLNPKSGAFLDTLGWIYYMNEQYKEALEQINHAAEIIPDDPTIVEHLGDVLYKLGDEKQALPHWERSFVLDPENKKLEERLSQHGADLDSLRKQADELKQKKLEEEKNPPPAGMKDSGLQVITLPVSETNEPLPDLEPGE
jgi:tetratricopeptide (TPR) repeat protein